MWGTGDYEHIVNPDMPWNEEIRSAGLGSNAFRRVQGSLLYVAACGRGGRSGSASRDPRAHARRPARRRRDRHAHKGKYLGDHISSANTLSCRAAKVLLRRTVGATLFEEIGSSSPGTEADGRRPGSRHRDVHRHRGLDALGRGDGRSRLARVARRTRRRRPVAACPLSRSRGEHVGRQLSWRCSTDRSERSAARCRSATRCRRSASRCAPGCTPASARSAAMTSVGSPCTSVHA